VKPDSIINSKKPNKKNTAPASLLNSPSIGRPSYSLNEKKKRPRKKRIVYDFLSNFLFLSVLNS
jgi:hypothetical protein